MKLFINLIRNLLGAIIAFFDVITRGTKLKRSPEKQVQVAILWLSFLYQNAKSNV